MSRRLPLALLLAAAILPYFVGLGASSIWDANEAFYVETPREMMERGDYITPTFNYELRLNKPVLSYWIVAASYKAFGVSVAAERITIALGGMILVLTAFFLGRAAADPAVPGSAWLAAWWSAIGLAIAPRLLMFSRRIFIDIYISMFLGLTLLFFALSERYPARRRTFLALMYAAVGLGMLTKGPIAALLPGLVFGAYLLLHGELKRATRMMIPAGIVIVLAIVVPYYAALYDRHGWAPITSFVMGENVARYTDGVGVDRPRGPEYYLPVVFTDSFPWSLLLAGAAAMWLADRRLSRSGADLLDPAALAFRLRSLLWIWILTIVVFFTLSQAKQDLYIFPIVPAVAALGGTFVARAFAQRERWLPWLRATTAGMGVLMAAAGAGTLYIFESSNTVYAVDGAAVVGWVGTAGGVLALVLALLGRAGPALSAIAVATVVLNWTFVTRVLPGFERYKPVPALASEIERRAGAGDVIAHYNVSLPSMVYYLRRHIEILVEPEPLFHRLRGEQGVFAVLSGEDYDKLQPLFGVPTCVIARRPTVNMKLRSLLERQPLPEVLLIANRCPP